MTAKEDDERPDGDTRGAVTARRIAARRSWAGRSPRGSGGEHRTRRTTALTREEREAAARDPGPAKTVYAPASERVPKPPLPRTRN